MEAFLALVVFVVAVIALDTRSRLKGLEWRLKLVENELRRRIAIGAEVLPPDAEPRFETPAEPLAKAAAPPPAVSEPADATAATEDTAPLSAAQPVEPETQSQAGIKPESAVLEAAPAVPVAEERPDPLPHGPQAPSPAKPQGLSFNFEELFGRKLPIWAGGITLAIAGVLIVKYAVDIGLFARIFTPPVQAIAGLLFGFGLISAAEWAHAKRDKVQDPRVAQALSGAGISTLYAVVLVAANAYHLITPLAAFVGLAIVTAMALGLSLRHGAPSALLGLAGGLAAPALHAQFFKVIAFVCGNPDAQLIAFALDGAHVIS